MATKNGERFLREQIDSILCQLGTHDELVISDDASTDTTTDIIASYQDSRIKLIRNEYSAGVVANFEAALTASSGEYIFLSDQDDVWEAHKVELVVRELQRNELVISDCLVVDRNMLPQRTFFASHRSGQGFLKNLIRNSYMGCCMAFRRNLLARALPFPKDIPMHDLWIGLIGEMYGKVSFLPEVLVYHRRHLSNATTTGMPTRASMRKQFADRYRIIKNLIFHKRYEA